jgi:hypothetical protein
MSEFANMCINYEAISRALASLKEGKAQFRMAIPGEEIDLEEHFPEIGDKFETTMELYLIDLRRQIRDRLQVDEAELQIDKVSRAMFGRENNANKTD